MSHGPRDKRHRQVGVFEHSLGRQVVRLAEKGGRRRVSIPPGQAGGAKAGELVVVEALPGRQRRARIIGKLDEDTNRPPYSLMAIKAHDIPHEFPKRVLAEAKEAVPARFPADADLTSIPFVTIDPPDARDRDDAVCAEPDLSPENPGGHIIHIAIADVARFVTEAGAIDQEAQLRGNSTYFPDLTVPMLPPALCEEACSLEAGKDRYCLVASIVIHRDGNHLRHKFQRGLIRSRAALHYTEAQAIADSAVPKGRTSVVEHVNRLWAAYRVLENASRRREPLQLELAESGIRVSGRGEVESVQLEDRLDSHRLIEEFMILANVCAAETIHEARSPGISRIHEEPERERIAELARTAVACGLPFSPGVRATTRRMNELLQRADAAACREHINLAVLRSMAQARYSTDPAGHFGLNLRRYLHFTSPIRRYADLLVHRILIRILNLGPGGISDEGMASLAGAARHLSATERRSVAAEREARDRFLAAFLEQRVGAEFDGTIVGAARQGLFVRLKDTGAEGMIHRSRLGHARYNRANCTLRVGVTGRIIRTGMQLRVRLVEAEPLSGTLQFELAGTDSPQATNGRGQRPLRRRKGKKRK